MKNIFKRIKGVLFPQMHEFDEDKPIINKVEIVETHRIEGQKDYVVRKYMEIEGYQCKKCPKIMWINKEFLSTLPRSMRKCKKDDYL